MKRVSTNTLVNVLLCLCGITLLIFAGSAGVLLWVTRLVGVLFLLPSLLQLLLLLCGKGPDRRSLGLLGVVPSVGGICFGVLMLLRAEMFSPVLIMVLGALIMVLGLYHVVYLTLSRSVQKIKWWHYILPLVIVLSGGVVMAVDGMSEQRIVLLCGVSLLLFAVMSVVEHYVGRKADVEPLSESVEP